jgi:hypothetical protein
MRLAADSDLIDAGANIGLPFFGTAPDLGAFESVPEPGGLQLAGLCAAICALLVVHRDDRMKPMLAKIRSLV